LNYYNYKNIRDELLKNTENTYQREQSLSGDRIKNFEEKINARGEGANCFAGNEFQTGLGPEPRLNAPQPFGKPGNNDLGRSPL
jgi:hypothetical protein